MPARGTCDIFLSVNVVISVVLALSVEKDAPVMSAWSVLPPAPEGLTASPAESVTTSTPSQESLAGSGVADGLGVAVGFGVAVGLGDAVAVGVGVGGAVGVGDTVGLGEGVGTGARPVS